jgi:hypothetical protein
MVCPLRMHHHFELMYHILQVARRRLKRPPRRSAHLLKNRARVSLAEAGIDRVAPKVAQDVKTMRDQLVRDDERTAGVDGIGGESLNAQRMNEVDEGEEAEGEDDETGGNLIGVKVPG